MSGIPATGGHSATDGADKDTGKAQKVGQAVPDGGKKAPAKAPKSESTKKAPAKPTTKANPAPVETAVRGLRDVHGITCPLCGPPAITKAGSGGAKGSLYSFYYCENKEKGCAFSHKVPKPGGLERLQKQVRGQPVKTPVRDGGNLGGLPPV